MAELWLVYNLYDRLINHFPRCDKPELSSNISLTNSTRSTKTCTWMWFNDVQFRVELFHNLWPDFKRTRRHMTLPFSETKLTHTDTHTINTESEGRTILPSWLTKGKHLLLDFLPCSCWPVCWPPLHSPLWWFSCFGSPPSCHHTDLDWQWDINPVKSEFIHTACFRLNGDFKCLT